jgi:hypothetical protein
MIKLFNDVSEARMMQKNYNFELLMDANITELI